MRQEIYDNGAVIAQERPSSKDRFTSEGAGRPGLDPAEMMKRAEAAATPGAGHEALEALVGEWDAEVKCWREPDSVAQLSRGTSENRWILDGHFLQQDYHGEMMGKPFRGLTIMGYDNTRQCFTNVWISDMQTSMFSSEGKGSDNNKIITLEGRASCAATDRKDIPMRTVFRILGPDKHIFEMFDEGRGESAKTMEITYTRR